MSDAKLREFERNFKLEPSNETAVAWAEARRRYEGVENICAYRIVKFAQSGTYKLVLTSLTDNLGKVCATCKGSGKYDSKYECGQCLGSGIGGVKAHLQIPDVNKLFDYMRGRFIVGRWRRTPGGQLRWVGP